MIHIDRDYNTDEEISKLSKEFNSLRIFPFITMGTDVESHFLNAQHINFHHPDISIERSQELINEVAENCHEEGSVMLRKKSFGEKYAEKSTHFENQIKELPQNEPLKYCKGKSMFKQIKQKIKDNSVHNDNSRIHQYSQHLAYEPLTRFAGDIWNQ